MSAKPAGGPRVSVVIPTHNRARTIERAIRSVLEQSFEDLEVIVIDDASTDDTVAVVGALDDSRVRLVRLASNEGACAARNRGIEEARGPYVAFQDSDDAWRQGKLARQMRLFEESADAPLIAYCGFVRKTGDTAVEVPGRRDGHRSGDMIPTLLHRNLVSTQTLVAPRECLLAVGGFADDLPRLQDWDLAIRLARLYPFRIVDAPLVDVFTTPGSITKDAHAFLMACRMLLDRHQALFAQYPEAGVRMRLRIAAAAIQLRSYGIASAQLRDIARMGPAAIPAAARLGVAHIRDMLG